MLLNKYIFLLFSITFTSQVMVAMQSQDLMPRLVPSLVSQELMKRVGNGFVFILDPDDSELPSHLREKAKIYYAALAAIDYPTTISVELLQKILLHPDVMEALLYAAGQGRSNSRNDFIRALFTEAAKTGNTNALQFFINKGIKINEAKRYGENALDWAIRFGQEEAKNLLIQNGAQPTQKNNIQ